MSSYKCSSNQDSLINQFKGLKVHNHKNNQRVLKPPQPKRVIKQYYNAAYKYVYTGTDEGYHFETCQTEYNIIDLTNQSVYEEEYEKIESLFWETNNHDIYGISSIQRIENPYLLMSYLLKKEELEKRNKYSCEEKLMFHGTTEEGANEICKFNFDWRRCGMNTGTDEGYHFETCQTEYNIIDLTNQSVYEEEYEKIESLFWETNNHDIYGISSIQRIENPYLLMSYLLKKEELEKRNKYSCEEKLMFHGTTEEGANEICKFNFDWRRCGMNTGHKFGQGVSFSPSMIYASDYPERNGYNSVMLVARVLVGFTCVGNPNMVLPKDSCYQYDNSVKPDNRVYVNYEDNTFYPAYKIYYGTDIEDDNEYRYLKRKALNIDKRRRY